MSVQTSSIIGSYVYQASDRPRYKTGNTVLLVVVVVNVFVMYPSIWLYYGARNRYKERKWTAMTVAEQKHCASPLSPSRLSPTSQRSSTLTARRPSLSPSRLSTSAGLLLDRHPPSRRLAPPADLATTTDEGTRRLDFRFIR